MTQTFHSSPFELTQPVHQVRLPAGDLSVRVHQADLPLDALCGFGARRNPRRGFLFVSKVLGRHMPTRPRVMRDIYGRLAAKLPEDLPGPVLVIAMAEMAICLGQGAYEELVQRTGREDLLFCHTTRFRVDAPIALDFHEEHSHATSHLLHVPADAADAARFRAARTLILVDDEMTTGSTFINLAKAFARVNSSLEQVITVVITDWTGPERLDRLTSSMPAPFRAVSLLQGEYTYTPWADVPPADMPNVTGNNEDKTAILRANYGRLGLSQVPAVPRDILESVTYQAGERLLVLGTGEFAFLPFKLAEWIESQGVDVSFQSTTRSPIMVSHDIGAVLSFPDNYDDGIPNFLYNVRPEQYDRVAICYETPARTVQNDLVNALDAQVVLF